MVAFAIRLTLLVCLAFANQAEYEEYNDFRQLMKILAKPRILDRKKSTNLMMKESGKLQGVSWKNCGASNDPFKMKSLKITPDPVALPGNVSLSFKAVTDVSMTAPITMELTVEKKIWLWIEIPCIDQIGSCTIHDVCALLPSIVCPSSFSKYNIPCRCPYHKGIYELPMSNIPVAPTGLPNWLKDGEYRVTAKLSSHGQPLGCVFVQLSVVAGNQ